MNYKQHKYYGNSVIYKSFGALELKADSDSRKVSFYAAGYGNRDLDGDILIQGCCAKSIQEHGPESPSAQKIAYLYMHDMSEPIGRITLLREDAKGLYVEAEIDRISEGDRVLEQYKSGTLNQHSIGFRYIWDKVEYDEDTQSFIVKEIQLFEVSVVTIGANENTPFAGFKSEEIISQHETLNKEIDTFLKGFDATVAYRARQLFAKVKSLAEAEPDMKAILMSETKEAEPKGIDWSKVAENLNL